MSDNKVCLGDAVYADYDGYSIKLTVEDGIQATNIIRLEPAVLDALIAWRKWLGTRVGSAMKPRHVSSETLERLVGAHSEMRISGPGAWDGIDAVHLVFDLIDARAEIAALLDALEVYLYPIDGEGYLPPLPMKVVRLLAANGRCTIESDDGATVTARWKK